MIVTADNILQIEACIHATRFKAADTETYGLGFEDSLFSIIVAASGQAFYFNFKDYFEERVVGLSLLDPIVKGAMRRIFGNHLDLWFLHNAKFDLHKLRRIGVEVAGLIWDTKVHARILQNNLLNYTLDALTKNQKHKKSPEVDNYIDEHKLFTNVKIPGKKKLTKLKHFDRVPFAVIAPYGCDDALATEELGLAQMKAYESRPTLHALRDNEIELTKVIFEMESTGIQIDPDYVMAGWKHEEGVIRDAEARFLAKTGVAYQDTKKLALVQILKYDGEIISFSEAGNPILDKHALKKMTSPVAKIVQKIRYNEKRISSFYSTFMQYRDSHNAIHANMDTAGTETGRFSMKEPNLQQLSKNDEPNIDEDSIEETDDEVYAIRGCFRPRAGKVFVQWDWKQQEYKLMADYAKESGLITKIRQGYDVHLATAELVGITRDEAKQVNFAILYGAGAPKLAAMLKIGVADAKKLISKYFAALPMVENFIERVKGVGAARGYIFNWLGRVCNIARRDWAYILPNHLIQGSGADVMKVALVRVKRFLKEINAKSEMVLTVHDSLIMEMVPEEFHLIPKITEILESVYVSKHGIVLTVDLEHSYKSLAKKDLIKGAPQNVAA